MSSNARHSTVLWASILGLGFFLPPLLAGESDGSVPERPLETGGEHYSRRELRVNQFTASSQERVALASEASGESVVVWQSRRQENGGYGVYARRVAADGSPLGAETRVNATTRGMQMFPAVAIDGEGACWFAFGSHGQDGDQGAIVVRRFDAALATATGERIANELVQGDQRDPALVGLAGGSAFVVWSSDDGAERRIEGRVFGPDGEPRGPAFRIDEATGARAALPTIARDDQDRVYVAWAESDPSGRPSSIRLRAFEADGRALGAAIAVETPGSLPVEPSLAATGDGSIAVGWLEAADEDYQPCFRRLAFAEGAWRAEAIERIEQAGGGYTTGLALDLDRCGEILVAWNRHAKGEERAASILARRYSIGGECAGTFEACGRAAGEQRLAVASGARRLSFLDDGRMAFAWEGDGGFEDASAAHLSWLIPEGHAWSTSPRPSTLAGPIFADAAAAPHDPPSFDRQDRVAPEVDIHSPLAGGDFDFLAVSNSGWTPPDPHMAIGPNHVVVMTNGEIAFFDKLGNNTFRDEIEDSFGFWGQQGATGFVFDPEVIYDPYTNRFMAMCCERSSTGGAHGFYLLAISDDSDPNGSWFKYRIDSFPTINDTDIDSPNIAVDANVIYLSADFFGPDKLNIIMIDKSSVLNGGTPVFTSTNIAGDQSQGFPVTYDSGAPAQYMIGFKFSTATTVRMYAIQNALTVPVVTSLDVTVPSYSAPEDPPQQGTSGRPETFEARFWSAVYRNGHLWATHHVNSGRVRQRWYEFDMANWPISGTPTLVQSGEIDLGGTIRTFFGSLWVDASGNMGMVYARSSPTEFISMERTWRAASDPLGTTRPPVQIIASTSPETSGRWGDYSSTSDDPTDPGHFWGHHEYRDSTWRTRVARWAICSPSFQNFCSTSANSAGAGSLISYSGSASVSNNDFGVFSSGNPANQNGIFFMGPNEIQVPFGNGFLCVGGSQTRYPIVQSDSFGIATYAVDNTVPPALGKIVPGSTWKWQYWYRDPMGGGAAFNLSDGLSVGYCP